jgi:D-3-phosphoglycerate dehydrogenase
MKHGSILINTARGGVMEDVDLLYYPLKSGKLRSAYLDVLPQEPFKSGKLFDAWKKNEKWVQNSLIINPHAAFYSQQASIEMRKKVAINAKSFLEGMPLRSLV